MNVIISFLYDDFGSILMNIKNVAIHQIIENPDFEEGGTVLPFKSAPAQKLHPVNDPMYKLCKLVNDRMNQVGRGSSKFKDPTSNAGAANHFSNLIDQNEDFLTFSVNLLEILANVMPRTATENYIAFIHYTIDETEYVIVCVLKLEEGVTIDSDSMEVVDVTSIQKKNIHEGARVSIEGIDDHKADENVADYITWIKTKSHKLSNYFQELFNVDEYIDNKSETTKLKKALDHFINITIDGSGLDDENKARVRDKLREDTYGHIHTVASNQEALDIEELEKITDAILSTNNVPIERTFIEHINEYHDTIPNLFKPYDGATKTWGKLKTTIKSTNNYEIKLVIDRAILHDKQYVEINTDNNEITIKNLSDTFMKELN